MSQDIYHFLSSLSTLLNKSGSRDRLKVVYKELWCSASFFYEIRRMIQGHPVNPSIQIEIMPDEQLLYRFGAIGVDDFLLRKLIDAGVAIP